MLNFEKIKSVWEYWNGSSSDQGVEPKDLQQALKEAGAKNMNDNTFA